jgi:hypothetical protein
MIDALAIALTAVATSLPAPAVPDGSPLYEAPQARQERLAVVAVAVAAVATRARCEPPWDGSGCRPLWPGSSVELASVLLALGHLESGYAWHVHAGRCRTAIGECDAGRARSPWQVQRTLHTAWAWDEIEGTGSWSTFAAAWSAARVAAAGRRYCAWSAPSEPWLEATVSAYATGGRCRYPRAQARARFVVSIEGRIRAALSD